MSTIFKQKIDVNCIQKQKIGYRPEAVKRGHAVRSCCGVMEEYDAKLLSLIGLDRYTTDCTAFQ
jgi:hypothetical protein